jgi:hypothetical protein
MFNEQGEWIDENTGWINTMRWYTFWCF